jgi:hypothetical protein
VSRSSRAQPARLNNPGTDKELARFEASAVDFQLIQKRNDLLGDSAWLLAGMKRSYEHHQPPRGTKTMSYTSNEFTVDEVGFIQIALTKVLAAAARGELDLNRLAREELASRGLDDQGFWVGFDRAKQIHNV